MDKEDIFAGCLVLHDQMTGTSPSARVSYGLALHHLATFSNCQARAHSWGHRGETVTVKAKKRNELRSFRLAAVAAAALAAGFLAWIVAGFGGEGVTELVSYLVQASAALLAAAACFRPPAATPTASAGPGPRPCTGPGACSARPPWPGASARSSGRSSSCATGARACRRWPTPAT
jgi:hypothetical protein